MRAGWMKRSGRSCDAHFDEGEIVELAAVIGLFNYFNRFNDALQIPITGRSLE